MFLRGHARDIGSIPIAGSMSRKPVDPDCFTVKELAVRWRTTRHVVLDAIHEGRLHAFQPGGRNFRVSKAEVARFEAVQAGLEASIEASA